MRIIAALSLLFFGCAAQAASAAEPLNIKEGLWETTSTVRIEGLQLPPALLQSLPEEQRAQLERVDGQPHIDHTCVTRKDITEGFQRFDKQSACTRNMIASTSQRIEANITCTGLLAGTGTARVDAPSSTQVQAAAALQSMLGNVTATLQGRWLSAACDKVRN